MKKSNQYEWLIVTEGNSDITIYKKYLKDLSFHIIGTGGKGYAINMSAWDSNCIKNLENDLGRTGFKGLILVIDSDDNSISPFRNYKRGVNSLYINAQPTPKKDSSGAFWVLDNLKGTEILSIKGINVPRANSGCLETELLSAYGFPTKSQPEYNSFIDIIKQATNKWNIQNNDDGKPWWEINEDAKMDKFIYHSQELTTKDFVEVANATVEAFGKA